VEVCRFPCWLRDEKTLPNLDFGFAGIPGSIASENAESSNLNSLQRCLMDVSIDADAEPAIRRCHLWRSSHKEMLIGHHQFPFFFSSFLLRRAFRDVKQIFDDCFMFQHISKS
jgi:hypothetical protein